MSASWSSCSQTLEHLFSTQVYLSDPIYNLIPPRQLYGQPSGDLMVCASSPNTTWRLFTVLEVRFNQSSLADAILRNYTFDGTNIWGVQIMQEKGLACSIDYALKKSKISYDFTKDITTVSVDDSIIQIGSHIPEVDNTEFFEAYTTDCEEAPLMLGNHITNPLVEDYPDGYFGVMSKAVNASYTDFLYNETLMVETVTRVYNASLIYAAAYRLTSNDSTPVQGQISFSAMRLHVSQLTLWLMVAGLTSMAVLSVVLAWKRPVDVVPCNTAIMGGIILVIARSHRLRKLLQGTGRMRQSGVRNVVSSYMFQSRSHTGPMDCAFSIEPITVREDVQSEFRSEVWQRASNRSTKWWRPLPLRPSIFAIISCLPLALIATLEVLQRLSARDHGITTVPGPENIKTTIGTRLVPSLVMTFVTILYDSICFNVSLHAPFQKLKRGHTTMQHSLMSGVIGKIPPHALCMSVRHRHWAATFANVATIVGTILTIAASGLYTADNGPGATDIKLQRTDIFNSTWADSVVDDGGAAVITTATEYLNLSYPLWTFNEVALPAVQISDAFEKTFNATMNKQSTLTTRLPALRASLNCTIASEDEHSVELTTEFRAGNIGKLYINVSTPLPSTCMLDDREDNSSMLDWSLAFQFIAFSSFVGIVSDLHVGSSGDGLSTSGEVNPTLQKNNPPGCPSLGVACGNFSQTNGFYDSAASNFTLLTCSQLMTEIGTDITVSLPGWAIASAVPDESTIKYLDSDTNGSKIFQYRPQAHLDLEMTAFNYSGGLSGAPLSATALQDTVNVDDWIDSFFAVLLHGKHGIDPAKLWGPSNRDRLVATVQAVYRRYMAQVASHKMRTAISVGADPEHQDSS